MEILGAPGPAIILDRMSPRQSQNIVQPVYIQSLYERSLKVFRVLQRIQGLFSTYTANKLQLYKSLLKFERVRIVVASGGYLVVVFRHLDIDLPYRTGH